MAAGALLGPALLALLICAADGHGATFRESPATATRDVTLLLDGPPQATQAVVAPSPDLRGFRRAAPTGPLPWRLTDGPDGDRHAWLRYLDAAGRPIGDAVRADITLDRSPPAMTGARLVFRGALRRCPGTAAPLSGGSPNAGRLRLTGVSDLSRVTDARAMGSDGQPGPWRPLRRFRPSARTGATLGVQVRDAAGNVTPWTSLRTPARRRQIVLGPRRRPFSHALQCRQPAPRELIRRVNAAARGTFPDRARLRPGGSSLIWTQYEGQGLYPNWVHAGTELNARLRRGRRADYRAGVSEVVAQSRRDRAGRRAFRVNENHFTTPDDRRRPPWRDGMGTAVILALLVPAIPDGDPHEDRIARRVAGEYLTTFAVDHRRGGARWTDRGPGAWYLEYTYRTRRRVLNGFMQALVSLDRFSRQAGQRGKTDPRWRPLARRARVLVRRGAVSLHHWLPAYDLGSGRTRYALGSGPASDHYREYHVELLRLLAGVPHLADHERARFAHYASRWER